MTTPFKLFELKPKARDRVLLLMDPIHLLFFHQISNKATKEVITSVCKKNQNIEISINFDVHGRRDKRGQRFDKNAKYLVSLQGNGHQDFIYLMEEKFIGEKNVDLVFGDHKVPCIFKKYVKPEKGDAGFFDQLYHSSEMKRPLHRQVVLTYWNYELFDAVMDLADYFSDVFATPITELITSRTMSVWKFRRAIQWLISRQSSIKRVDYLHNELSDSDISMFFGNCNVTERLAICMKDNDRIRHHRYFDLDTLKICMASWVTIDYLLDMDCIFFRISGAQMTSFDCNRFIKSWLNGTNYRLEIISMNCGQILERDDVLDGLETRHRRGYLVERFKNHKVGGSTFEFCIRGGFDVQREDGKLATVDTSKMDRGLFLFVVWTEDEISEGCRRQESEGTDGDVGCTLL